MKNKKNDYIKNIKTIRNIFGIYAIVCLIIYIIGFIYAASYNFVIDEKLLYYGGIGLIIPIGILIMIVLIIVSITSIKLLFGKYKILYYVNLVTSIFTIIIFSLGIYIFISKSFTNIAYEEVSVKVLEVKKDTLVIDYSSISKGEKDRIEIKKPFYKFNFHSNEIIDVKYLKDNIEDIHYVIPLDKGIHFILISILIYHDIICIDLFFLAVMFYIDKRNNKKNVKYSQ